MQLADRLRVFLQSDGRSAEAGRQILLSALAKGITILCSLLVVPLTINYVNPTRYGIWLTISSIIAWIGYFDFGLGNGFRNRFAEAKAKGDLKLASEYVSTAYLAISCIVVLLFIVAASVNGFIDWSKFLKVDGSYRDELRAVFLIVGAFFCLNMVVSLFTTMLTADQKNGVAAWVNALGQLVSLVVIWILTRVSEGSLTKLALYFSGVPCLVTLVISIISFNGPKYRQFKPSFRNMKPALVKDILSLGVNFFLVYLCLLVIFQMMNIVLAREIGAEAVTQYNIAYRYFNVLYAVMLIIITPFWSAFTDAYTSKDFAWMKRITRKLENTCILFAVVGVLMLAVSSVVYRIWIGESVEVAPVISVSVMVYIIAQMTGNVYMYLINGIGTIRIQLCIYLIMAIIAWPLMTWSCRQFGVAGIVIAPGIACILQAASGRIQLSKIMKGTASGWWLK